MENYNVIKMDERNNQNYQITECDYCKDGIQEGELVIEFESFIFCDVLCFSNYCLENQIANEVTIRRVDNGIKIIWRTF